jgi:hypothetical protein
MSFIQIKKHQKRKEVKMVKAKRTDNVIYVDFRKMERIEDHNCDAIAAGHQEHRKLAGIKTRLQRLDMLDGILGNEPTLTSCIREVEEAMEINHYQTGQDRLEQEILDKVVPIAPGA